MTPSLIGLTFFHFEKIAKLRAKSKVLVIIFFRKALVCLPGCHADLDILVVKKLGLQLVYLIVIPSNILTHYAHNIGYFS